MKPTGAVLPLRIAAWLLGAWLATGGYARAGVFLEDDLIMVQGAPGTIHYDSDPSHSRYSWLVGAEWLRADRWLAGYSYFNNSFNQKSQYLYAGKWWPLGDADSHFYFKLTGGVLVGYRRPYEDKIPFNHNGVAPGVIPGIGYKLERLNVQMNVLGTAGLMFTVGYDLGQ